MADKIQVQLPTLAKQEQTDESIRKLLTGVLGDDYKDGDISLLSQVSVLGPDTLRGALNTVQGTVNDIYTRLGDATSDQSLDYFLKEIYSRIVESDGYPRLYELVSYIGTDTVRLKELITESSSGLINVVETVHTGVDNLATSLQNVSAQVDSITVGTETDTRIYASVNDGSASVLDVAKENKATLAEVKAAVAPTIDGKTVTIKEVFSDQWAAIQYFLAPTKDKVDVIYAKVTDLATAVAGLTELITDTIAAQKSAVEKLDPESSSIADVINALQMNTGTTAASALDPDESSVADVVNALKTDTDVSTEE